jgi:hypothetical protein
VCRSSFGAITNLKIKKIGFRATCIWPFNPKVMNKIQPSQIYIAKLINDQEIKNNTTYDEVNQNQNPIVENPLFKLKVFNNMTLQL